MKRLPQSPINTLAGLQLKNKKEINEPRKNQSRGVDDVKYKLVKKGKRKEEETRPSRPSVKFTRLTNKTIAITAQINMTDPYTV